jgi:carbonic anhydrase
MEKSVKAHSLASMPPRSGLVAALVLAALVGLPAAPPLAAEGAFAGYITYSPADIATDVAFAGGDLAWLREVANLLSPGDSTILRRVDSGHWAALTRRPSSWLLQIHDEDAWFNCRALVDPKTGLLTVQRGVDLVGSGREADAARVARLAVLYVGRMRSEQGIFGAAISPGDVASAGGAPSAAATPAHPAAEASGAETASRAWRRLVEGNLRFSQGRSVHPGQDEARLAETAKGQKPFAIVVTCSDSRLAPEILFDQGLGDLFVVRTAGEVVGTLELGSIEYAVEHLGAGFILVLGHERCGAVDATIKGGVLPPAIAAIAARIKPALARALERPGDLLDNTVKENAKEVATTIAEEPLLAMALEEGKLSIKAAYYDLDYGEVTEIR